MHAIEPVVPLQETFSQFFKRARYAARSDYRQPIPPPALSQVDQQWGIALLAPLEGG